jgi:hypothetical protein
MFKCCAGSYFPITKPNYPPIYDGNNTTLEEWDSSVQSNILILQTEMYYN